QNALLRSLPRNQCIFYATEETESEENELIVGNENLPSLRSLVMLFNKLSTKNDSKAEKPATAPESIPLSSTEEVAQAKPSLGIIQYNASVIAPASPVKKDEPVMISTINDGYFDAEQGFVGLLLSKKLGIYCFELESNNKPAKLYINFDEQVYYSEDRLEQLQAYFSAEQEVSSRTVLESLFQQDISNKGLKALPLKNLVWYAVFSCSQGRVRKGYQESDIVHLKRWPDINLPGCRGLIKLAAYMQSNAVELKIVQEKTGFSMQQVYDFYNACHAIGLIEQVQQADVFEKKLSDKHRQLFSRIGSRLNQAK
ncbi:MAG: hypothetical protein KAJ63_12445, partial [Methyloprofundus sp.]|nr:hypothetical protein [Methyloprofundus sp.]